MVLTSCPRNWLFVVPRLQAAVIHWAHSSPFSCQLPELSLWFSGGFGGRPFIRMWRNMFVPVRPTPDARDHIEPPLHNYGLCQSQASHGPTFPWIRDWVTWFQWKCSCSHCLLTASRRWLILFPYSSFLLLRRPRTSCSNMFLDSMAYPRTLCRSGVHTICFPFLECVLEPFGSISESFLRIPTADQWTNQELKNI